MNVTTDINQQTGSAISLSTATATAEQNSVANNEPMPSMAGLCRIAEESWRERLATSAIEQYRLDMNKEYHMPPPLMTIDSASIATRGNLSAIVGEAKCRKTFLTSALIGSLLNPAPMIGSPFANVNRKGGIRIVWLDTEQAELHVRRVMERIAHISGHARLKQDMQAQLTCYMLREVEPKERLRVLREMMEELTPDLVVVDGVADLQRNTNDLEESDALIGQLMALSTFYQCHILCVLHTNPGSDKARGHLGSSLQRKAETVIFVHKAGDKSIVEPQFCRNEPFKRFAFRVNDEGIPVLCDLPVSDDDSRSELAKMVAELYGGAIERKVLTGKLIEQYDLPDKTAAMRISRALQRGQLVAVGKMLYLPGSEPSAVENATSDEGDKEEEDTPF